MVPNFEAADSTRQSLSLGFGTGQTDARCDDSVRWRHSWNLKPYQSFEHRDQE